MTDHERISAEPEIPQGASGSAARDTTVKTAEKTSFRAANTAPDSIRLYGTTPDSIVDGPGLRYTVFVQGCHHACPGCHNPDSHDPQGGTLTPLDALMDDIRSIGSAHDVTLSGGDPFEQAEASAELARRLKAEGYGLWTYTGYRYEDLLRIAAGSNARAQATKKLLELSDVLVDGPYNEQQRSLDLQWCGSTNQRVIDLAATRAVGHVVEWHAAEAPNGTEMPTKPESW